jgi:hypothetical protein
MRSQDPNVAARFLLLKFEVLIHAFFNADAT